VKQQVRQGQINIPHLKIAENAVEGEGKGASGVVHMGEAVKGAEAEEAALYVIPYSHAMAVLTHYFKPSSTPRSNEVGQDLFVFATPSQLRPLQLDLRQLQFFVPTKVTAFPDVDMGGELLKTHAVNQAGNDACVDLFAVLRLFMRGYRDSVRHLSDALQAVYTAGAAQSQPILSEEEFCAVVQVCLPQLPSEDGSTLHQVFLQFLSQHPQEHHAKMEENGLNPGQGHGKTGNVSNKRGDFLWARSRFAELFILQRLNFGALNVMAEVHLFALPLVLVPIETLNCSL
jgi:hypothetical protein